MWDGFWFLANGRAFHAMPADLQKIVAAALDDAAVQERADVKKLNDTLQSDLTAKGMAFNTTDPAPFRDALRAAGFYKQWQAKYGAPAWTLLEKGVGSLA
jgi:TRAP-type C4-dicarboxylate transport system substrate-binding protein